MVAGATWLLFFVVSPRAGVNRPKGVRHDDDMVVSPRAGVNKESCSVRWDAWVVSPRAGVYMASANKEKLVFWTRLPHPRRVVVAICPFFLTRKKVIDYQ